MSEWREGLVHRRVGEWVGKWTDVQTDEQRQVLALSLHVRLLQVYMASLCGWETEAPSREQTQTLGLAFHR